MIVLRVRGNMCVRCCVMMFFLLATASFALAAEFDLDMKVRKLDGEPGTLRAFVGKGKWTLVMFWETTCSICKQQEPEYARLHLEHKDKDLEVVGVAIDGSEYVDLIQSYVQKNGLPYPNFVTDKPEIREKFLAATGEPFRGTPTFLLFAPKGELKAAQPGMLPATSVEAYIASQSSNP